MARNILVASLGNPAPYQQTLHSAGHIILNSLLSHFNLSKSAQSLSSSSITRSVATSSGEDESVTWSFWSCPSYMNVSGPAVQKTWNKYLSSLPPSERRSARLVVLHDELEAKLGAVKVRKGGSAKGHNGIKSCVESLGKDGFWRIGVGVGRPIERDRDAVSRFVLRRMTSMEKETLNSGDVLEQVIEALEKVSLE
jgi:PTH1 family peptidyl-tRNA hydrolase